jgi:hypothetical protein
MLHAAAANLTRARDCECDVPGITKLVAGFWRDDYQSSTG